MKFSHLLSAVLLLGVLAGILSGGCAKGRRYVTDEGVEVDWRRAMELFNAERYYRAQQALKDITLNYSGSAIIDSAYYFLGRTSFEMRDYLVAADEFRRVTTRFPSSQLAADASYYEALSFFELSPSYPLDQQFMTKSFNGFQRYLEDYSGHELNDSAYVYMGRAREQLALKEYRAAELYYQLGEYASAILYSDAVLADYYDTRQAASAQFLKARSYYQLKDWQRAGEEFEKYLSRFPDGRDYDRARQLAQKSSDEAASLAERSAEE